MEKGVTIYFTNFAEVGTKGRQTYKKIFIEFFPIFFSFFQTARDEVNL